MWFNRPHPFHQGLLGPTLVGLLASAIVSIGFHADAIETSPARCQDRVVALSVSNTCPTGTFIEVGSDGNGGRYIVCHCKQPINVIIQMSPSQQQDLGDDPDILPAPEVDPAPKPIEL